MSKYDARETVYTFSELVLIARPQQTGKKTTWYIECQECGQRHLINRVKPKQWVARCQENKIEYTITPAEYYIMKPVDLTRILGAL